jgi:dephospho-CoA kinase
MTFRLALTGSIGTGKSTTAEMFRQQGIPVWDADATVYRLYDRDGAAVGPVSMLVPDALRDGAIDRDRLRAALRKDPDLLVRLESLVHPLVAADRGRFCARHADAPLVLLDIPLLFETGGEASVDAVLVVTVDAQTQRARVLARPGMTEDLFRQILARQTPDAEKRARADYLIETNTLEQTRAAVAELIDKLTSGGAQDA